MEHQATENARACANYKLRRVLEKCIITRTSYFQILMESNRLPFYAVLSKSASVAASIVMEVSGRGSTGGLRQQQPMLNGP